MHNRKLTSIMKNKESEGGIGHVRDKVKVVLDLLNCATKKTLEDATGVDTSNLAAKTDFIALKLKLTR